MMLIFLHGLLLLVVLPSVLLTASAINCGDSRLQHQQLAKKISGKNKKAGAAYTKKKQHFKKHRTRSSSEKMRSSTTKTTKSDKTDKSLKSSKVGTEGSGKSSIMEKEGSGTSSVETKSQKKMMKSEKSSKRMKKAKKLKRGKKSVPVTVPSAKVTSDSKSTELPIVYTNRTISRQIGEEARTELKMQPRSLNWKTSGGVQKVYLTNASDERRAVKVKCSDNTLYRVNPVFAFVEPGQVLNVDVVRQNGGAKADKMVFVWAKAERADKDPRLLFNDVSTYAMSVLPLIVND